MIHSSQMSAPNQNSPHHAAAGVASLAEPKTPMWLPALGGALMLVILLYVGLTQSTEPMTSSPVVVSTVPAASAPSGSSIPVRLAAPLVVPARKAP